MDELTTTQARQDFSNLMNQVSYARRRILLTRRGKPLGALVPVEDLRLIQRALKEQEDRLDCQAIRKAWKEQGQEPLTPWGEVKAKLGLK